MNVTFYLIVPFVTWAVAQAIKFFLALVRGDVDLRYLYASGGMPSVHSAVVTSLATWALIAGGPNNPLFGFAAVLAAIVMYDSFGVRRSAGEQAKTINKLIADLSKTGGLKNADDYSQMREILGHKPLEVVIGSILGFVIACLFGYQTVFPYFNVFNTALAAPQAKAIMIAAGGFALISVVVFFVIQSLYKRVKKATSYNFYLLCTNLGASLLVAILAFLYYENVSYPYGLFGFVFIGLVWLAGVIFCVIQLVQTVKSNKKPVHELKKEAWLKKAGKKR